MSWSKSRKVGLTHHDENKAYEGYTLFSSVRGQNAYLVDIEGQIVKSWHDDEGIQYIRFHTDGRILYETGPPPNVEEWERIGGSATALKEVDWDGNIVWEYRNDRIHHDFVPLPNGNFLILLIEGLPDGMTEKVKGGRLHEDDPDVMWGDKLWEITPAGDVVYEWLSWEHLEFETDTKCPLETRKEWTHTNGLSLTPDGDFLLSLRELDTVAIVSRETGEFTWKWGRDELSHQHNPTFLDTGKVLIFDNGAHRFKAPSYSRVIEVDPKTDEITWEYKADPLVAFNSFAISGAERLPNGNTLVCEGVHGRFFEVTPEYEIVWEYLNPFFQKSRYGRTSSSFRAHRYTAEHPALKGKDLNPANYADLNELINNGLYAVDGGIIEEIPDNEGKEKEAEKA